MIRKALPQLILLITILATGAMSEAQARPKITLEASVPFDFVVGNQTFPAGTYVFEMATGSPALTDRAGVLVVRSHQRRLYAAVAVDVTADAAPHVAPTLLFHKNGDRTYLSKVWRQGDAAALSLNLDSVALQKEMSRLEVTPASGLM